MEGRGRPSLTRQLGSLLQAASTLPSNLPWLLVPQARRAQRMLHLPVLWATEGDPVACGQSLRR